MKRSTILLAVSTVAVLGETGCARHASQSKENVESPPPQTAAAVELTKDQLTSIAIAPLGDHAFFVDKEGIGTVDFDNKLFFNSDLSTPVYPPGEGTIVKTYVELGDDVQKGQRLYAIQNQGHSIDVPSPMAGQVTALNAPLGLWVQPGKAPAPCAIADVARKWMLGSVSESDGPLIHDGQSMQVRVMAFPGKTFMGEVTHIYATIDPNTHRMAVRGEIGDSGNELRSGMLATFSVRVQNQVRATAIPANGVVHEGDGTLSAWVTTDRQHFTERTIEVGLEADGMDQVLKGLQPGELVVTNGAVFLSNMLHAVPSD